MWLLEMPYVKSVTAGVLVGVGARDEIYPKEAGIAHALEHMHLQGTRVFPSNKDIGNYIEEVGGRINARTTKETTSYYAQVPAEYTERAVHILSEQLNHSLFLEEKIQVEMKNIIQESRRRKDNPMIYAGILSDRFMYRNHPLSRDTLGSEDSVLAFSREDFTRFKNRCYNRDNYNFIIVGNITADKAVNLFNAYFGKDAGLSANKRKFEKRGGNKNKIFIEHRDINQLNLSLSALIGKATSKDSLYLDFFATMISGGISFPLFEQIRDTLGLCYSIGASVIKWSDAGKFTIFLGTDRSRYEEAINEIFKIIEKYKNDEPLLEKAKKLRLGRLSLLFENTFSIVDNTALKIAIEGKPYDFDEAAKEIKEVTIENIENAVNKYLKPEMFYKVFLAPNNFKLNK